jgi:Family of unknown function (DUF6678)
MGAVLRGGMVPVKSTKSTTAGALQLEWFDIAFLQETRDRRRPPTIEIINHAPRIAELLQRVGLEFEIGKTTIRIFGYAPKTTELFDA